ncbi:MAG TPA: serine/threonine-protein kinase [Polyangiaceae bacterium]|nr:serine/threonine-protein kinase [Polyangiaceae bacterium]
MRSVAPSRDPAAKAGDATDFSITRQTTKIATTSVVVPLREDRYAAGVIVEQKYELVRLLGEGGMGSVWVAKNLTLDCHVALKLMRADLAQAVPGAGERMLTEARAAASIHHPAIVQIFDFGRTRDGDPFISMELLDGESLSATLKRRERLPATKAIQVLMPIADALVVAHSRGVVHRDLKPDNILLARLADGRVQPKILDFGIAKREASGSPKLTLDGTVLGSPAYMSPEQARGQTDIDLRVDVWAFSVMLYELVTGCTPFAGESYNALLYSIVGTEPLTLAEHGIDDPELWAILARGMDKERETRFGSMRAIGRELARYLLNRKVKTDIAQGPLKPWLEASVRPQAALPSVFASLAPSGSMSDRPPTVHPAQNADIDGLLELMREPVPPTQLSQDQLYAQKEVRIQDAKAARGRTTVGRQRSMPTFKVPAPLARVPRWIWFAGPAAIAFLGSVIASLAHTPDAPAAPAAPVGSAAAAALTPKAALAPTPAESSRAVVRPSKPEPAVAEARPTTTSETAKAPTKPVARPAAATRLGGGRKQPSRTELKNPFAH